MALRACVILLFVLLSGSVHGNGTVMTSAPGMQEPSTSQISTVTQTAGTGSPSTSAAPPSTTLTTTGAQTTMAVGFTSELLPTQDQKTTNATTGPPTTTHHSATTEPPTTTHHSATTEPPTTTHHNATTEPPTTTHHNATTAPPTTPHQNTTNSTTEAPTTAHPNVTTAPTPPPTTPPMPKPTVGNYSVRPNVNSSICLLANMGLQFSFTTIGNASRQTINVDPNETSVSGSCGIGGSDSSLLLKSDKITVRFVFTNVSEKFRLHALELSVDIGQGKFFNESNANLSLWEASVGSSYMCRKEQSYNISDKLTLNTFELQVQPFGVQKNMFSTAHECSMDDISLLIPIIVGAVLAGLIFIVVIAYVIGRRRTYVGYQTL